MPQGNAAYVACLLYCEGPSGDLMVRVSDQYSEGLGFESHCGFIFHLLKQYHYSYASVQGCLDQPVLV